MVRRIPVPANVPPGLSLALRCAINSGRYVATGPGAGWLAQTSDRDWQWLAWPDHLHHHRMASNYTLITASHLVIYHWITGSVGSFGSVDRLDHWIGWITGSFGFVWLHSQTALYMSYYLPVILTECPQLGTLVTLSLAPVTRIAEDRLTRTWSLAEVDTTIINITINTIITITITTKLTPLHYKHYN